MTDLFGWTKSDLAAYYASKANQKKIAASAIHTLVKKRTPGGPTEPVLVSHR